MLNPRIRSENITQELPQLEEQQIVPYEPLQRQHRDLKDLMDLNPYLLPVTIYITDLDNYI
jgi:hypothetical protein